MRTAHTENAIEMSCAIYYCECGYYNLPRGVPFCEQAAVSDAGGGRCGDLLRNLFRRRM